MNNKKISAKTICSIIALFVLIVILTIVFVVPKNTDYAIEKKYYTGELLSPNFSANLIDYLDSSSNSIISPYNLVTSLAVLYNGSDNNTNKELKKFLGTKIETINELLIPNIKNLNYVSQYDSKVQKYYEQLIKELYDNSYNALTTKTIKMLSSNEKNNLILLLSKLDLSYKLLNNNLSYDLNYIKSYELSKRELQYNEYNIYDLIAQVTNEYTKYQTKNIIINNNTFILNTSSDKIPLSKTFKTIANQYNSNIIEHNQSKSIKELNNNLKDQSNYNFYLDEEILSNQFISLNSIFIDYNFEQPFDGINTTDEEFFINENEKTTTHMMYSIETSYFESLYAYAIKKKFVNNKYSFIAILPKEEGDFKLSNLSLNTLLKSKKNSNVVFGLPRFSYQIDTDLIKLLHNYSVNDLFTNRANLSIITNAGIYLGYYHQKNGITIGENGTSINESTNSQKITNDNNINRIVFNRPFAFLILDEETNNVIMIGKVINPNK